MTTAKFDADKFYKRLFNFGQECQRSVAKLPKTDYNRIYGRQLIRSSSSPGANYIEAQEALSRKDFVHRLKICRKETKESVHWLRLIQGANPNLKEIQNKTEGLISEGMEIIKILTASIKTSEMKNKK